MPRPVVRSQLSTLVAAFVAVIVLAAAAACTGGSPGVGDPRPGGVLRLGIERPRTFDPARISLASASEMMAVDLLFDGLTDLAPGSAAARPALAARWESTPDFTTWRFVLAAGSTFSNGRAVVAADVAYSLSRVAAQGPASVAGARLEVVAGYAEVARGEATTLSGVVAVDDQTVEVVLRTPLPMLPELLANPVFGVVPREAVEAAEPVFAVAPVGSGPFRFVGSQGDVVRLERVSGGGPAVAGVRVAAVELALYDGLVRAASALGEGDLDVALLPPGEAVGAEFTTGVSSFAAEMLVGMNLQSPKLADARFRQAIVRAVDRVAAVRATQLGRGESLASLVPVGAGGGGADAGAGRDPCGDPCRYEPEVARGLVAEVFPGGGPLPVPEVAIDYPEGASEDATAVVLEASLEAVGIPAVRRPHPIDEYRALVARGGQELFQLGWVGVYPSPDAYLTPLFGAGVAENTTGFENAEVDTLLAVGRRSADAGERQAAWRRAEELILTSGVVIPLLQHETRFARSDRVQGLELGLDGTFAADQVWLTGD